MKNGKNDARQKKRSRFGPVNVPRNLQMARDYLVNAFSEDENLGKFIFELEDGHKLTLEELHAWLIAAIGRWEKNGPRSQALKELQELVQSQHHPERQ